MKHEWKKAEKPLYLPGKDPAVIEVPAMRFFLIDGTGDPNTEPFQEAVGALYALSYGVKMLPKKGPEPPGYRPYAIYPLEGLWTGGSFDESGWLDKSGLRYTVMIRQPDFVDEVLAAAVLESVRRKKPGPAVEAARFGELCEGRCVQLLHTGSYDDEPASFARMDAFCAEQGLRRAGEAHREIYLGDPRRTAPDKLRTVLRYAVTDA